MCSGSDLRVGILIIFEVIDHAEFFQVVLLGLVVVAVIISLNDIEHILLILHSDCIVILVSLRYSLALSS